MTEQNPAPTRRRAPTIVIVAALAAVLGAAVLYGKGAAGSKDTDALCPAAKATAARLAPLAQAKSPP